jgi:protein-S-isoprenylcysteine O-methyltransferase Ste14
MSFAMTPLLFALAFCAVAVVRLVRVRATTGVNPYVIDHRDPTHRFVAHVLYAVAGGVLLYFSAIAVWPALELHAGYLTWAASDTTRTISIVLMGFAIVWTAYAQASLGSSLRVGIPKDETPPLRMSGAFALSRNAIFLGMLAFVVGLFLWSPSAVTAALLIASYMAIEIQVRDEERSLERAHGEAYRAYRARVRRWL